MDLVRQLTQLRFLISATVPVYIGKFWKMDFSSFGPSYKRPQISRLQSAS